MDTQEQNMNDALPLKVQAIHQALGIPARYWRETRLPVCHEPEALVEIGVDMFGRTAKMEIQAWSAWQAMQQAAAEAGIELLIVSAFRSIEYQADLIRRKLAQGRTLESILSVNAAPGYSEHHTGRAVDIACPGFKPLEEDFEQSAAFAWLGRYAGDFGFQLSFPRENPTAIAYEPWHWCFHPASD